VKYGQPREEGSDWKTSPHIRPYMIDMRYIFEHAHAPAMTNSPAGDISSGNIIILNQGRDVH